MSDWDQPNQQVVRDGEPVGDVEVGVGGQPKQVGTAAVTDASFNVADATVDEVKAFVTTYPEALSDVLTAEKAGRNRTTLVAWLEAQGPF